jgi:hypothetical protein
MNSGENVKLSFAFFWLDNEPVKFVVLFGLPKNQLRTHLGGNQRINCTSAEKRLLHDSPRITQFECPNLSKTPARAFSGFLFSALTGLSARIRDDFTTWQRWLGGPCFDDAIDIVWNKRVQLFVKVVGIEWPKH